MSSTALGCSIERVRDVTGKIQLQLPHQGGRQLLTARQEMLDAFDKARAQSRAHEVEVYHGRVAEAACRKWLRGFLPRRYGVTSGYVVSTGIPATERLPHFDVIIYDRLESPVLWVEDSPDSSEQGRSRAIPVEYVRAVLEVKSRFSRATVKSAVEHLSDLAPLMGVDEAGERYRLCLPDSFFCACIFYELRQKESSDWEALEELVEPGFALRGFGGGIILRGEGHQIPATGRLTLSKSNQPLQRMGGGSSPLLNGTAVSASREVVPTHHAVSMLVWFVENFSMFAFDMVRLLNGTYEPGRISSFYGLGVSLGRK